MGAYIVMYPRARIQTLSFGYFIALVRVPGVCFLGFWFLLQLLLSSLEVGGNVAYWAHIGGFVAGMLLVFVFKKAQAPVKKEAAYEDYPF
jgi:membrane associated rhomboid family serine protease